MAEAAYENEIYKHPEDMTDLEEAAAERTVADITEAEKVEFLQRVRQGLNRQEAANSLGYKGGKFRALCSPQSPHYDEEFAAAYGVAVGSMEFQEGRLERLRAEGMRRALLDSDRLLIKMLEVYDPDWEKLRQKEVNVNVQVLVERVFDRLSLEQKKQLMGWLEEYEAGTIDGEAFEVKVEELTSTAGGNDD